MAERAILHVDMDAFYASVEQRDEPTLAGLPVVVGGRARGVVAAASYEARVYGIRSAMPMSEALRRCPDLVRVKPRMAHYRAVSRQVFSIFREFTPVVEGLSLDEAFLDVTGSLRLFGTAVAIAKTIKQRIVEVTALTASVGVSYNKLVAKIASDLDKPDGLVVITPNDVEQRLDPLPVAVIPGIGRETLARLESLGIASIRELRCASECHLDAVFGRFAGCMRQRAAGIDDRPVVVDRADKSISAEETFDHDLYKLPDLERELLRLSERTCRRLRQAGFMAGTVRLKIRESDFTTCTRQARLTPATDSTEQIFASARRLLTTWLGEHRGARLRLLGVGCTSLARPGQGELFEAGPGAAPGPVDATFDEIRDRFGERSLARARTLGNRER